MTLIIDIENRYLFAFKDWNYSMDEQTFIDLINKSMQDAARQVRLSTGRLTSQATREDA